MTKLVKSSCARCGRPVYRSRGRMNENQKFGWEVYCSRKCQGRYHNKQKMLICENLSCNKTFLRAPNTISPHNYCSQSCAAIINNEKRAKDHAKIKPSLKICIECGERFRKSTGNKKYCSIKCRIEANRYTPEELLKIIKRISKKLGRPPARRELSEGIDKACVKVFGSWNNAILAAGLTPNRSHDNRMYKRSNAKALDGHLCDSISELLIDNWFYRNNIFHKRNARYPKTNHSADWVILVKNKSVFVEYFGLANDSPRYDRTIQEKVKIARRHKINLIGIYPKDLYPKEFLEEKLKNKFKKILAT